MLLQDIPIVCKKQGFETHVEFNRTFKIDEHVEHFSLGYENSRSTIITTQRETR